ncbi:MAG TPA: hypothetical protein VKS60_22650, partial [Stellaceae bacterium]|nr:hypothetical protein [Stellaceae bacterium]
EDPGPFSFADPARVERILTRAGFLGVAMEPADLTLDLACSGGLEQAVAFAAEVGPASRAMEGQPGREAAIETIREALAPMVRDGSVMLPAAVWLVSARNA